MFSSMPSHYLLDARMSSESGQSKTSPDIAKYHLMKVGATSGSKSLIYIVNLENQTLFFFKVVLVILVS